MRKVANQKKKTQKKTTPKKSPFFGIKQTFGKTTASSLLQSIRLSFWTTRSRRAGEVPHLGDVMPLTVVPAGATATGGRPWAVGKEGTHVGQNCGSPLPVRPPKGF